MNNTTNNPAAEFGAFVRSQRIKHLITGRDASQATGMLASNFSKLEHGVLTPPRDAEKQRKLSSAIGIPSGSEEEARFFDLAAKATDSTPVDIAAIISANAAVPLLLRTIGNKRLGKSEMNRIVEIVHGKK